MDPMSMGINFLHLICCNKLNLHAKRFRNVNRYQKLEIFSVYQTISSKIDQLPWYVMVLSLGTATNAKPRKLKLDCTCCCKSVYDNSRVTISSFITNKTKFAPNLLSGRRGMSSSGPINMSVLISLTMYLKETILNSWQRKVTRMNLQMYPSFFIPSAFVIKCCELFTRWLLGTIGHERMSRHKSSVLASPPPVNARNSNEFDYRR